MVLKYRSMGNSNLSSKRKMMNLRILLYSTWHAYGEKCHSISKKIAIRKQPSNKLIEMIYCIRLLIAIGFAREALRAINYANHFLEDD